MGQPLVWVDDEVGYRCPTCALYVCIPKREGATCPRCVVAGPPPVEELAAWLHAWVQEHPGTDLRDEGGRLRLVCRCDADLGISYGPMTVGPVDADKREALAYFEHQAEDLLAWQTLQAIKYDPAVAAQFAKDAKWDPTLASRHV